MSRHSTIENNLLRMTRARVLSKSFQGWKVTRAIDSDKYMPCELCSTKFLRGAFVMHTNLAEEIAVGGECLGHLLAGNFLTKETRRANKESWRNDFKNFYRSEANVIKFSDWSKWMQKNIDGFGLEKEWLELSHMGRTKTLAGMKKLIKYHDDHRPYPASAFFSPEVYLAYKSELDNDMTLTEFRNFDFSQYAHLSRKAAGRRNADARSVFMTEFVDRYPDVADAWKKLSPIGKRASVALFECQQSGRLELAREDMDRIFELFPRISVASPGMFFWTPKGGLGFIEPNDELPHLAGQAWMFVHGDYKNVNYRYCVSVDGMTEDAVRKIESIAFELQY